MGWAFSAGASPRSRAAKVKLNLASPSPFRVELEVHITGVNITAAILGSRLTARARLLPCVMQQLSQRWKFAPQRHSETETPC